jgi:hypothetical protein
MTRSDSLVRIESATPRCPRRARRKIRRRSQGRLRDLAVRPTATATAQPHSTECRPGSCRRPVDRPLRSRRQSGSRRLTTKIEITEITELLKML